MKNGRALQGHRRIVTMIGTRVATRRAPSGGWDVGCICGWAGGNWPNSVQARAAYRKHLDHEIDVVPIRCKRCGVAKPQAEMRRDYRHICLACFSALGNEWQQRNPEASARHKRNHHLLKRFGITVEEAEALLAAQGGVCAICRLPISDVRGYEPHVDHDHETGRVRGILCLGCNVGLGGFRDDPVRLRAAIAYLGRDAT